MKMTRDANFLWIIAAGVMVVSALLALTILAMDRGGPVGLALSVGAVVIGFCSVLALALVRRREMLTLTVPGLQWWVHTVVAGMVGGFAHFAAYMFFTEHLALRLGLGQNLAILFGVVAIMHGAMIIQIVLVRVLWPEQQPHAYCAACKHQVLASQRQCPECGSESIVRT